MQIAALNTALPTTLAATPQAATSQTADNRLTMRLSQADDGTSGSGSRNSSLAGTSGTFAAEILNRLQAATTASNAGALLESGAAADLQASLAGSIEYIREKHGDAAATAVMGIIVQGVGDGSGGEDAFGNALLSSLRFIDRNFGIAAGDAAMAQFNGSLNNAVNGYFQNGQSELFYAADGSDDATGQIQGILSSTLSDVYDRFGEEAAQSISELLTENLEETGVNREGLGKALAAADDYLRENYDTADYAAQLVDQPGLQPTVGKGAVLDLLV